MVRPLDADADLLIYGCDLASTDGGRALIESIGCACAIVTSRPAMMPPDMSRWVVTGYLEYAVGDVTTGVAFNFAAQSNWYSTLDITSNLVLHNTFDTDASDEQRKQL